MKFRVTDIGRLGLRLFFAVIIFLILSACGAGSGEGLDINGQPVDLNSGNNDDLYSQVQEIFDARCTVCHTGAGAPQGLVLAEGQSWAAIVNVVSTQQDDQVLVSPSDAEASYLVKKIRGDSGITGGQMPRNGPPFLSDPQVQTIIDWVNAGAPEPAAMDPNAEFIAKLNSFSSYADWQAVDYSIGPTNLALGSAHNGDAFTHSRRVFANDVAMQQIGDEFANGSILVKEVVSWENGSKEFASSGGLLAMVKRGAGFNSEHGGWEWFMLESDLRSIAGRGANLMDDGCNLCHQQADTDNESSGDFGGRDYVFTHSSEFIPQASDFSDYQSWTLIDDRNDANELLDGMAHGANSAGSTRKVYKKQLYANPDSQAQGYPIGTLIAKEVIVDGEVVSVAGMAKRGGNFNTTYGNWEWFMLDPDSQEFMLDDNSQPMRGADLMDGMCNGCHFAASPTSGNGIDFVFKHGGDPYNNNDEFIASNADFANYSDWTLIDERSDNNNLLGGMAHQAEVSGAVRRVYKKQFYARPEDMDLGYPVGTVIMKEVSEGSKIIELAAMVKRGAEFNTANAGWEWFMLNTSSGEIAIDENMNAMRGADLMDGMCSSCHALATGSEGEDYVFKHANDPFNHPM